MPFTGDNYSGGIGRGISGLGEGFARMISENQKAKKEHAGDQAVIDYAVKHQMLTPEEHTKYLNGSRSQKNDIVAGFTRTFAMDIQRQNAVDQRREQLARTNLLTAGAASKFAGPDSREGAPQPLVLPDGSVVPDRFYVPGARQVISTQPQLPLGTELGEFVWNGKQLVKKSSAGAQSRGAQFTEDVRRFNLDDILRQIGDVQGEIAAGNVRSGPDWLPLGETYGSKVERLQAQRDALTPSLDEIHDLIRDAKPATPAPKLSALDQQALIWARSNSDDPRAAKVLARLGLGSGAVPSPTPAQTGKVLVKSPDGKVGYVPEGQLAAALQQGYTKQ